MLTDVEAIVSAVCLGVLVGYALYRLCKWIDEEMKW